MVNIVKTIVEKVNNIYKHMEECDRETEAIKKSNGQPTKFSKNMITEMKNVFVDLTKLKQRISKLEDRSIEITQLKHKRKTAKPKRGFKGFGTMSED